MQNSTREIKTFFNGNQHSRNTREFSLEIKEKICFIYINLF